MAGMDHGGVPEREQDVPNRRDEDLEVAARQIGPSDRTRKQRVPDEQLVAGRAGSADLQADATWTVAGRVMPVDLVGPKRDDLARLIKDVDRRLRFDVQPED